MPLIICASVIGCLWAHAAEIRRCGSPPYVGVKRARGMRQAQHGSTLWHRLWRMLGLR